MENLQAYLTRKNASIPATTLAVLEKGGDIPVHEVLKLEDINHLLQADYLDRENGFHHFADGSVYVAALTNMPRVSIEMIDWWFWWHAAEDVRYQIWYPKMHFTIAADFQGYYNDNTKSYRERLHLSRHLVTEDIGTGKEKILIDFMSPTEFGFDARQLDPEKETIICARVGSPDRGVWGTKMCHVVRMTNDGVEMRSRFWIGHDIQRMGGFAQQLLNSILNKPFVKRKLLPKNLGKAMFHHCSQEYSNLAEFLPQLYQEEKVGV